MRALYRSDCAAAGPRVQDRGGETQSDGRDDDNRTNILGGAASLGHAFAQHFSAYVSYGNILASSGNADEWLLRANLAYSFYWNVKHFKRVPGLRISPVLADARAGS